jgi:hypothetical protein
MSKLLKHVSFQTWSETGKHAKVPEDDSLGGIA